MSFELEYAERGFQVEAARAKGRALPAWYEARPEEWAGDDWYMRAFADLSTTRGMGLALGPIPWTAIVAYADRAGLDPECTRALVTIVSAMDRAWLEYHERRAGERASSG